MQLEGRSVIVTGAGRGIGRALARQFGRCGARVACCARRAHEIEETVRLIEADGGTGLAVPTDVTVREQVQRMVTTVLGEFGTVDVLFNNAGSFAALGGIWEVDPDRWWHDVTVNLLGVMHCCQAVLPHMMARDEGIIINMLGGDHIPGGTGYSFSKVGVSRLTELMAREQQMEGTSVLVVGMGPGFVHTEMTDYQISSPEGQKWLPSSRQAIEAGHDLSPERCAETTVELIRAACPAITAAASVPGWTSRRRLQTSNGSSPPIWPPPASARPQERMTCGGAISKAWTLCVQVAAPSGSQLRTTDGLSSGCTRRLVSGMRQRRLWGE